MCHALSTWYYEGLFEEMSIGYNTTVELTGIGDICIQMLDSKRTIDMVGEYRELFMDLEDVGYFY